MAIRIFCCADRTQVDASDLQAIAAGHHKVRYSRISLENGFNARLATFWTAERICQIRSLWHGVDRLFVFLPDIMEPFKCLGITKVQRLDQLFVILQKLEISPTLIGEGILKVEELKLHQCDPFNQGRLDRIAFPATG